MTSSQSLSASPSPQGPRVSWSAFDQAVPGAVSAMRSLSQAIEATMLEKPLTELIKVRVSQINGCAFCLKLHQDWGREAGLSPLQIDLVATWRDASCFDARQRAALAWSECLTLMPQRHVEDADFAQACQHFSEAELAALTAAIAAINAWNRIAGSLRFTPPGMAAHAQTGA